MEKDGRGVSGLGVTAVLAFVILLLAPAGSASAESAVDASSSSGGPEVQPMNVVVSSTSTTSSAPQREGSPESTTSTTISPATAYELTFGPLADANGPYLGTVGSDISFDGSKTLSQRPISRYSWDFGDGSTGEGETVTHSYKDQNRYRITLTAVDDLLRTGIDSRVATISLPQIILKVTALPVKSSYNPKDVISRIEASVYYSNGSPVDSREVTGAIKIADETTPLYFSRTAIGAYKAEADYTIPAKDAAFADLYVNASDAGGNTVSSLKKISLVPDDPSFHLQVTYPDVVGYGEPVDFIAQLISIGGLANDTTVIMFEGWSNRQYVMTRDENTASVFHLTYTPPEDAGSRLSFLFYGVENDLGARKKAVAGDVSISLSRDLSVQILSPADGENISGEKDIKLKVKYPDGRNMMEESLQALVGNSVKNLEWKSGLFEAKEGTYEGKYTPAPGESTLYIWVADQYANGGGGQVRLVQNEGENKGIDPMSLLPYFALGAAFLYLFWKLYGRKMRRDKMLKEYAGLQQKIESLKKMRKSIMHEFYARKLSEDEARKRILECEKEMLVERDRMKRVMRGLGLNYKEAEEKGEVIEWIIEKLKAKENPEILKKALIDLSMDPDLVDKVKNTLM